MEEYKGTQKKLIETLRSTHFIDMGAKGLDKLSLSEAKTISIKIMTFIEPILEQRNELLVDMEKIYNKGQIGISYVGKANYQERESEARNNLSNLYDEILTKYEQ